ncbi:mechanosensitive ion channel family protein [Aquimarina pacifica]|uniref:mechanosensitive ion channel family protein n=1 Tax=Aquimarina pacifica TaxID=1296415 RepID=UPI0004B3A6DB|nr:mechanosensitive ion channel domain-containing protein [Aquimarina pacifica]
MLIQEEIAEQVKQVIPKSVWDIIVDFLNYRILDFGSDGHKIILTVRLLVFIVFILIITSFLLRFFKKIVTRKLQDENKIKFDSVFSFSKYFVYIIVILISLDSIGFNITAIFAASAALLVGVGLALQTLIQDIISGVFIFIDQTVHVGDIIDIEGKIGRVEEIKLRTTRAVTRDNKVLIIPNHKYLTSTLYNWTQNGSVTRESIKIGVAYGSDVPLVKELLFKVALENEKTLNDPEPLVLFTDFGESSLDFTLIFTMNDSFMAGIPKSEMRFEIDRLFREHNISIPFPQREVTVFKS